MPSDGSQALNGDNAADGSAADSHATIETSFQQISVSPIARMAPDAPPLSTESIATNSAAEFDAQPTISLNAAPAAFNLPVPPTQKIPKEAEETDASQARLRQMIFKIQANRHLDPLEKARQMQALMTLKFSASSSAASKKAKSSEMLNQQRSLVAANAMLTAAMDAINDADHTIPPTGSKEGGVDAMAVDNDSIETPNASTDMVSVRNSDGIEVSIPRHVLTPTYHTDNQSLGCKHYSRGTKFKAACCGEWQVCRFCHDDALDHSLDRTATETMLCMHCNTVQPVAQDCCQCQTRLGAYYCSTCKLWDNDASKNIYHCDRCGICRVGRGLGIDYFHCDKCNVCMALHLQDNHRCIERNLECDCPICGEYMFTSTHTVIFMPCGHCIHWKCYQEHIKNSYQCPICWKSLADMGHYFSQIDQMLAQHKMPAEYEDFWSSILCNDCEHRTRTKYHFLYHKCQDCGSYNTKLLQTEQQQPAGDSAPGSGGDLLGDELASRGQSGNLTVRVRSSSAVSTESTRQMVPDDNDRDNVSPGIGQAHTRRLP